MANSVDNRIEKYDQIFVPGSPITKKEYLLGREQEIKDLQNILKRPGQHAIIIGDRGVGKTSLVKQVLRETDYKALWRTCDPGSSFHIVFRNLLEDGGIDFRALEETDETSSEGELKSTPFGVGMSGKRINKHAKKYIESGPEEISPWTIFQSLESVSEKIILVLDEYDAIRYSRSSHNFNTNTAYTMKILADHNERCDSRMVVIGVANSSNDLLGKHESIQRSAREIYLRPLSREHIQEFLDNAESELGIKFGIDVKERLAKGSLGYPYFVHLVGLECIEAMLTRDPKAREVSWEDFAIGVDKAVDQAFRAELSKYKSVSNSTNSTERILIEGLASYPRAYPKREELRKYICKTYGIKEEIFELALNKLTQEKKFLYMSRREDEIRFIDPLMKAFIKERILVRRETVKRGASVQRGLFEEENF